jgi:hypothetical protein
MTLSAHHLALGTDHVPLRANLLMRRAHLMPLDAHLLASGARLVTLHGHLSMRHAGLSGVGVSGPSSLSLDPRLRAARMPLTTVPAAVRSECRAGEDCEAQQKRCVRAFHGAPPWAAAPGVQGGGLVRPDARPGGLSSKARTSGQKAADQP